MKVEEAEDLFVRPARLVWRTAESNWKTEGFVVLSIRRPTCLLSALPYLVVPLILVGHC